MISETKLNDTFPVVQFVLETFSKPSRLDCKKNGGSILLFVREDIPARLISIEKTLLKVFLWNLICARRIGLKAFHTIPTKETYSHVWKSSDEL